MNHLIGADPEVFLMDAKTQQIASAIGVLEGTKEKPEKIGNGALHKDNVLAELNIRPTKNPTQFSENITEMLDELRARANNAGLEVVFPAHAYMHEDYLATAEAQVFGCEPDYNAWELEENPVVNPDDAGNLRVAAGHVHISLSKVTPKTQLACAQWCDVFLGVPAVFADPDSTRRQLYGKAGSFRPKPYGIEYRVLSNFWLTSPRLMTWVWWSAQQAAGRANDGPVINPSLISKIQKAINDYDVDAAAYICEMFGAELPRDVVNKESLLIPYSRDRLEEEGYLLQRERDAQEEAINDVEIIEDDEYEADLW